MTTNNKYYRNILFLVSLITISFSIYGQGTIKTPCNQTVQVIENWDSPELIAAWEADAANWIEVNDSRAVKKAPATSHYNCHAYAWHISDGGDDKNTWLNNTGTNLSKYWTNDAYSSTSVIGDYTKIFYGPADHSAISLSSSNLVKSKWGWWGLYEHALTDCPFSDGAVFAYYSVPLSGDNIVCTSKTYSTVNISDATYSWSGDKVSINGTTYSESASKTQEGSGWVQCQISSPYSGTTISTATKNIWVDQPTNNDIDMIVRFGNFPYNELCVNMPQSIAAGHPDASEQGITKFIWDFGDWDSYCTGYDIPVNGIENSIPEFVLSPYSPSSQVIRVTAYNTCGAKPIQYGKSKQFYAIDCYGGYYLAISPNPTSGETTLSIEEGSPEEPTLKSASTETTFDENAEWDLEVYNNMQSLKLKKQKLKGKSTSINTQSWKEGIYMVRVKYKDDIITGKLVVKK
uniref:T9SS type A sorting domain-containing protein n=1 Tax=uncultured Draconibacterium sp. TaxID=1573823 RepID=UPI003216E0A6